MLLSRAARVPGANATCGATSRRSRCVVRLLAQQGSGGSMDSSSSSSSGDAQKQANLPQEGTTDSAAMFSSLSFASRLRGQDKGNRGTNVVLAGDGSEDTWRKLDKRVNSYPGQRDFTAIGTGGDGFRASMVSAVEQVVGSVHVECVSQKTRGAWISVTVGPVWVENGDQVLAIYEAMRRDERLKYFI